MSGGGGHRGVKVRCGWLWFRACANIPQQPFCDLQRQPVFASEECVGFMSMENESNLNLFLCCTSIETWSPSSCPMTVA